MTWGLLFLLGLSLKAEGWHTLRYQFSILSEAVPGVPQYSVVGYVDDFLFISYSSESHRAGLRARWMEKITDEEPQYWKESAETFEEVKKKMNDKLRNLMEIKDQPLGLHLFQAMLGCELHNDRSVTWFERSAYDGSIYTDAVTEGRGNSEQSFQCIKALKKLLKYGEESLQRRATPRIMVSERKSGSHTFLIGYAYGFYPREIEVKWFQNGVEKPGASRELLPNPDGTYQVRTTVEVQEGDDVKTYEYHVNHSSLLEIVTVGNGPPAKSWQWGLLVGAAVMATLMVVMVVAQKFLWKTLPTQAQAPGDRDQEGNEDQPHRKAAKTNPTESRKATKTNLLWL